MQCRISPTLAHPQNAYRGPLMVICKKTYVMLHLEAEWPSKQNILIAETILAEPGPQPGFKVWGGKIHF